MSAVTFRGAMRPTPDALRGPMSDEDLEALRERNNERLAEAKKALGSRWLLWRPETEREPA